MNIAKDPINQLVSWIVLATMVIVTGVIVYSSYNSTMKTIDAAQNAEKAPKGSTAILPKAYSVNSERWVVIKEDNYTLDEWKITMRVPFGYTKTIAATYVKTEDAYYFASLDVLTNKDCMTRYYTQIKATRPGLKVQRINGNATNIRNAGMTVTLDDYYQKTVKPDTNWTVFADDEGSMRRVYKVEQHFYYDLSELPTAKQDTTSQNQRTLFCKDARILEADEVFITSISTFKRS